MIYFIVWCGHGSIGKPKNTNKYKYLQGNTNPGWMFVITVVGKRWEEVLESHYQRRKLWPESLKVENSPARKTWTEQGWVCTVEYILARTGLHSTRRNVDEAGQGSRKLRNCTAKVLVVGKHRDTELLIHQISMSGKLLWLNSDQSHRSGSWVLLEDKIVWQVCRCLYQVSDFLFIFMVDLSKSLGMWGL